MTSEILLVDDNPDALATLRQMIERLEGVRVCACQSPRGALDVLQVDPGRFALPVTDYHMPEMAGVEFAMAASKLDPALRVLCITACLPGEPMEPVFAESLRKPFRIGELHALITRHLPRGGGGGNGKCCQRSFTLREL